MAQRLFSIILLGGLALGAFGPAVSPSPTLEPDGMASASPSSPPTDGSAPPIVPAPAADDPRAASGPVVLVAQAALPVPTPEPAGLDLQFDPLGVKVAEFLADPTRPAPTHEEWVRWVDLESTTAASIDETRGRLRRVPDDVLAHVLDEATGDRTSNPYILQLLWQPYLRLQGLSLDGLAGRLRTHSGLEPITWESQPSRCNSAHFEHGEASTGDHEDPESVITSVVGAVRADGPEAVRRALELMQLEGGEIRFGPDELRTDEVIAMRTGADLVVGERWIAVAATDPAKVHANLAHELGGHLFYGRALSCLLALHAFSPDDELGGLDSFQEVYRWFGYPETEIYAELKELPHLVNGAAGDRPADDVPALVAAISDRFPAEVVEVLFGWMAFRFDRDATLSDDARNLFSTAVEAVLAR